ncbi:MAG: hypothetical protein U0792_10830 [Gemmataceae bacterium]
MFAALTLSVALAAPVPVQSAPIPAGVAPRVMELKADASGKVMIAVTRMEKVQVGVGAAIAPAGGGAVPPAQIMREIPVTKMVELAEVKDLAFTTADGKKVDKDEAMKKLAGGAVVVVTSDGKAVSPTFLKVFKDDTLVLVSPELLVPQGGVVGGGGVGRPGVRPLPAPVPGVIVKPGVIQVVPIGPGGVQVEVAPEVIPVDKTPKPAPDK